MSPVSCKTPEFIHRYADNPILDASRVPFPSVQTYNAGFTKFQGKYVMVFRNDYNRTRETFDTAELRINLGFATSDDGLHWEVAPEPCWQIHSDEIRHVYDPRLTVIDGRCYLCFAMDTMHGVRGGVAVTEDFSKFEILSLSAPDNRNMVLFPEKIGGYYMRLERPMPVYGRSPDRKESFDIYSSISPDLRFWGGTKLLLGAENMPSCNSKIGPGAPPVRTPAGWLALTHLVNKVPEELPAWHPDWHKVYCAGAMLLDLEDPTRILGIAPTPVLVPEAPYETEGFRGHVVFPGGAILEESGELKIYYGAADTYEAVATCDVNDLIRFIMQK